MRKISLMFAMYFLALMPGNAQVESWQDKKIYHACPHFASWVKTHDIMTRQKSSKMLLGPSNPKLLRQLRTRALADQAARDKWVKDMSNTTLVSSVKKVDEQNLPWIKLLIETHGFPTKAEVGEDGVEYAWLLIQHADGDQAFRRRVLKILKPLVKRGEIDAQDYAFLVDRVLRSEGKPQRYGTQFAYVVRQGEAVPDPVPEPMEDPKNVDARRAAVGLMPLADYACVVRASSSLRATDGNPD